MQTCLSHALLHLGQLTKMLMPVASVLQALSQYGNGFLAKFESACCPNSLLDEITLVDTPGVLSGEKQRIERTYNFIDVCGWFATRCDLILLLFDPHKLDISDEFKHVSRGSIPFTMSGQIMHSCGSCKPMTADAMLTAHDMRPPLAASLGLPQGGKAGMTQADGHALDIGVVTSLKDAQAASVWHSPQDDASIGLCI